MVNGGEAAGPHAVDIQGPPQVIDLMLQSLCIPTFCFDLDGFPPFVESPYFSHFEREALSPQSQAG